MEKFHFRNKAEKVLFYVLSPVLVVLFAFYIYIYLEADPEALRTQGIELVRLKQRKLQFQSFNLLNMPELKGLCSSWCNVHFN